MSEILLHFLKDLPRVLEFLQDKYLPLLKGQKQGQNNSAAAISTTAVAPTNCDDKNEKAVTQMRHLLQRERNLVSELQVRKSIRIS